MTRVFTPADPANWSLNDASALVTTLSGLNFTLPLCMPDDDVMFGIGEDEMVLIWQNRMKHPVNG